MSNVHRISQLSEVHNESELTVMEQLGKGRDEMKKILAMTLVVMMTVASGFSETAKKVSAITTGAFVNKAVVQKAAATIKPTPLIAVAGTATSGTVPLFTDAAGDVTNSAITQVNGTAK
jgi:hypothetical protein